MDFPVPGVPVMKNRIPQTKKLRLKYPLKPRTDKRYTLPHPMAICEFSGEDTDTLVTVRIEGVTMRVAPRYAKYGSRVEESQAPARVRKEKRRIHEPTQTVRSDAPSLIRNAFQKLDTDEESLAKKLGMKESHLKAYLRGDRTITIEDARTFERFFSLTLIETNDSDATSAKSYSSQSEGLTLADLFKKAKRR